MAISLTVRELLTAQELAETELIAGAGGLDRPVRGVNVMEAPDIARWLRGGELLLSTGYQFREQPDDFDDLVIALHEAGAAALGGAADGEGEGRPDPQVLVTNDGRVGRSGTKMGGG